MDVEIRGTVQYPTVPNDHTLIMSFRPNERTSISLPTNRTVARTGVRAATLLNRHSSTEAIDLNNLVLRKSPLIQYVEVADNAGRLYCVNGSKNASCWIKIISLAKDCSSCNVVLVSTEKGVVLKTIRVISPGEPLLMWFAESILNMMNIVPYLVPFKHIQGEKRYICHICNSLYEYPNPLKIHLALKCDKLDSNYLWCNLVREHGRALSLRRAELSSIGAAGPKPVAPAVTTGPVSPAVPAIPTLPPIPPIPPIPPVPPIPPIPPIPSITADSNLPASLTLNLFPSVTDTFNFKRSPSSASPILMESPTSSGGPSPNSSMEISPTSSSTEVSPIRSKITSSHRGSAFKPYMNTPTSSICSNINHSSDIGLKSTTTNTANDSRNFSIGDQAQLPAVLSPTIYPSDLHAAQLEVFYSNYHKSKLGHHCRWCGKVYSRKYGLKIHLRTHTGYKPLKCKVCLRPFGDPSNLNKHVRLHADGETPYRCEYCGKVLVRRRDLERHIKSRHQDHSAHHSDASSDEIEV